jgi:hypothetical protein
MGRVFLAIASALLLFLAPPLYTTNARGLSTLQDLDKSGGGLGARSPSWSGPVTRAELRRPTGQ